MSLKEFRKLIRKYIEEELNEASVTANIDGGEGPPQTPYAFRKKKDEEEESGFQDGHLNPETGTTYEKVKKHEHKVYGVKTKKYKPLGEGKLTEAWANDTIEFGKKSRVKVKRHGGSINSFYAKPVKPEISKQIVPFFKKKGYKLSKKALNVKGSDIFIFKGPDGKNYRVSVNDDYGKGGKIVGKNLNMGLLERKITEGRYHEFRNDDTKTPKQKIGMAMRETRDSLTELERIVKMNVKLKNELNVDSRSYWKNTHKALSRISERLVKLANKVGQLQ